VTAEQIINLIATNPEYKKVVKNITKGNELWEDLFQELIVIICEYDKEKLVAIYNSGGLKYFIIRILQNQYKSDHSDFHKKYRDFGGRTVELLGVEAWEEENSGDPYYSTIVEYEKSREVHQDSQEWYANQLFKSFLKEGGYRKLERKTGISRTAITHTLQGVFAEIKDKSDKMRAFMEAEKITISLPDYLKRDIFTNSLYQGLTPEEVICQQLKKHNKSNRLRKSIEAQLKLF
jgi:hypothetical protein